MIDAKNDRPMRRTRSSKRLQSGLTTLEFVACTVAVVGGAWIGALYLGVDVRQLFHTALAEAKLLDKLPADWRPEEPENKAMNREQMVATLREELGALRSELDALRSGEQTSRASNTSGIKTESATMPFELTSKDKTLTYWSRLNDIAMGEAELQRDAESAADPSNAAKVFAVKGRISRFAAKSVEALPTEGVGENVVQFGRQLERWYARGGDLYERAVRIWETPAASREQLNQDWGRAETHHRNEAQLLSDKASAVRAAASQLFGQEFPEFAKPAASAGQPEPNAGR